MTNRPTLRPEPWRLRQVPPDLAARYLAEGSWTDDTLGRMVADGLGNLGHVGFRVRIAGAPLDGHVRRRRPGRPGRSPPAPPRGSARAPVVFHLPNWLEAARSRSTPPPFLGAVVVPIVHFYGPKEVGYILRRHRA